MAATTSSTATENIFLKALDNIDPDSIPKVDFSLLTSSDPDQRSNALHEFAIACQEWGLFVLVNHGIPETLLEAVIDSSLEFFELPVEEKQQYQTKSATDPINSSSRTIVNIADKKVHLWRDIVRVNVHPKFHCPQKPHSLKAIGENLGFEQGFIDEAFKLDDSYQLYVANYYPPCPQTAGESIGIPPHTDHGFLTFLIHNGVAGLQIQHNREWLEINTPMNSILVNIADHIEILSNGRYKSIPHRVQVNTEKMRISIAMGNSSAPDVVVAPAPQLVECDGRPFYRSMKYIEYLEKRMSCGHSSLDWIKINDQDD